MTHTESIARVHQQQRRGWLGRLAVDSAYVLTGLPVAIISFVLIVTGISLGVGLLITLIGIPVLLATLFVARELARLERRRLRWLGDHDVPDPVYQPRDRPGLVGWLRMLRDPQAGRDVVHALVIFPVATITWSVAVVWW